MKEWKMTRFAKLSLVLTLVMASGAAHADEPTGRINSDRMLDAPQTLASFGKRW
jgi:hypothetical protein